MRASVCVFVLFCVSGALGQLCTGASPISYVTNITLGATSTGASALALAPSSIPTFVFREVPDPGTLRVCLCADKVCRGPTRCHALNAPCDGTPALALASSGFPIIAHFQGSALRIRVCDDALCTSFPASSSWSSMGVERSVSLAVSATDRPFLVSSGSGILFQRCIDTACFAVNSSTLSSNPNDHSPAIVLDATGLPVIVFYDAAANGLRLARCSSQACSGPQFGVLQPLNSSAMLRPSLSTSIQLTAAGLPVLHAEDEESQVLVALVCRDPLCDQHDHLSTPLRGRSSLLLDKQGRLRVGASSITGASLVYQCNSTLCDGGPEMLLATPMGVTTGTLEADADFFRLDERDNPVLLLRDSATQTLGLSRFECGGPPDGWPQLGVLTAGNADPGDDYGRGLGVSRDGNVLAVGARGEDSAPGDPSSNTFPSSGAVYMLVRLRDTYHVTQMLKVEGLFFNDSQRLGTSVALSADGSVLAAGAANDDVAGINAAGAVYVFHRNASTMLWQQHSRLMASNPGAFYRMGSSVAISDDGNTVVAGAYQEASGVVGDPSDATASESGAVYVFERSSAAEEWAPPRYLKHPFPAPDQNFGASVSLSGDGDTLAVGARKESAGGTGVNLTPSADSSATSSGAVFIYNLTDGPFLSAYLKSSNSDAIDRFGTSVSLSRNGRILAVGAQTEDSGNPFDPSDNGANRAGAAYVFSLVGGKWVEDAYLKHRDARAERQFGSDVCLCEGFLAVGSTSANDVASDTVSIFKRAANSAWDLVAELMTQNALQPGEDFGQRVVFSDDCANVLAASPEYGDLTSNAAGRVFHFVNPSPSVTPRSAAPSSSPSVSPSAAPTVCPSTSSSSATAPASTVPPYVEASVTLGSSVISAPTNVTRGSTVIVQGTLQIIPGSQLNVGDGGSGAVFQVTGDATVNGGSANVVLAEKPPAGTPVTVELVEGASVSGSFDDIKASVPDYDPTCESLSVEQQNSGTSISAVITLTSTCVGGLPPGVLAGIIAGSLVAGILGALGIAWACRHNSVNRQISKDAREMRIEMKERQKTKH